ncbi:MAG: hypothetical protein SGPRY_011419 [Prymnesium sp.]
MCYRSERLLVYRDEEGSLLTRYNRRAVPPVRYSHDVALSIAKPDEALPLPAEKPVLSLVAFTTSGKEVARAYDYGPGPSRRGLSPAFELSLRPTGREKERSRYAREQRKRAPQREVRAVHPRARRAFFGAMPSPEPSYRLPTAGSGITREMYLLVGSPLRWGPPQLFYSRTGRGASWCSSLLCTLDVDMRKVDQGLLFGRPGSRQLAKDCIERLNAINSAQ